MFKWIWWSYYIEAVFEPSIIIAKISAIHYRMIRNIAELEEENNSHPKSQQPKDSKINTICILENNFALAYKLLYSKTALTILFNTVTYQNTFRITYFKFSDIVALKSLYCMNECVTTVILVIIIYVTI